MAQAVTTDFHVGPQTSPGTLGKDIAAGAIAGEIAGLVMAVVVMAVFTLFLGKGPLYPVQVIGSFALGDKALVGINGPAIIAGLLLHQLGPALFWGVVFGLAVHALDAWTTSRMVPLAIAVGLAGQIIDANLVLPVAFRALHGHDIWAEQVPMFWSWAAHLVFGLALLVMPVIRRRLD